MTTIKYLNRAASAGLLLSLLFFGTFLTGVMAQERDKKASEDDKRGGGSVSHTVITNSRQNNTASKPDQGRSDKPFNPWGDNRYDSKSPAKKDQPYNPWGDDRYDRKPPVNNDKPKEKPGYVIPGERVFYSDSYYWNDRNNDRNYWRDNDNRRSRNKARIEHRVPVYREGRYYYPSRPDYRPSRYGYWGFDINDPEYCRSIYFYYGYFPYVNRIRIVDTPYYDVSYYSGNIPIYSDDYYLSARSRNAFDQTLADIRNSWIKDRPDLFEKYVKTDQVIAVMLDGKYNYSVGADDYIQMTSDAVDQIGTISFTWDRVRQRTNGDYTAYGKHVYNDSDGNAKTVYVTYTLRMIEGDYKIVEVGSSDSYIK